MMTMIVRSILYLKSEVLEIFFLLILKIITQVMYANIIIANGSANMTSTL